jgi:predicted permease
MATAIGHALWRSRFGGDPGVVGRQVRLNGHAFTVIGVAAEGFRGAMGGIGIDLWAPLMMQAQVLPGSGDLTRREDRFLMLIGRLREGESRDRLRVQLAVAAGLLAEADPADAGETGFALADIGGLHPSLASQVRVFLGLLMGMVGVVLLITCTNVANLMLARVSAREREIAVRAALGAGGWRIAREFLIEGLIVAGVGGIAGLFIALWATRLLSLWRPDVGVPVALDLRVDGRVVGFAAGMSLSSALVFSVGPALRAARSRSTARLRESAGGGPERLRTRRVLVVAQVAMSALLLFGASLLARSLDNSGRIDPGFDDAAITLVTTAPELLGYDEARGRALWLELEERARAQPAVGAASLALFIPLGDRSDVMAVSPADRPPPDDERSASTAYNIVGPGYFDMLGIDIVRGRDFGAPDVLEGEPVVVVSEAMASRFWPDGDAPGRQVRVTGRDGVERIATVVGVVANVKFRSLGEAPRPFVYLPFSQWYRADMMLHVRASDPGAGSQVGALLKAIDPDLPAEVGRMAAMASFTLIPLRLAGSVLGLAGAIGLFLAATGVFGIIAYTVSRQYRDIAIRMALGAERRGVRAMVVGRALRMTLAGVALGVVAAIPAARLLRGLLNGVSAADPVVMVAVGVVFTAVAAVAACGPAWRASALDPAIVLRAE